jgi:hypothetical protein
MAYEIYFRPPSLQNKLRRLKESTQEDRELFNNLNAALLEIETDPAIGIEIPRDRIPRKYRKAHPLMKDCYKYDLPDGWRLIYYIAKDGKDKFVVIVKWMPHDEYVRDFNY